MSHREYEDEPAEAVRWMLEIDRLEARVRRDRDEKPPEGLM